MKKILKKKFFVVFGFFLGIGLLFLLLMPTKTHRLIRAIESNDTTTVKALLDSGVDPNRTTVRPSKLLTLLETEAKRPLTIACDQGNLQIVQLLLDNGATAEQIDGTGWSPLRTTLFYYNPNDPEIVKLLLEHGASLNEKEDVLPVFAAADMTPQIFDSQKTNGTVFFDGYDQKTAEGITEIVFILLGDNSINITNSSGQTLLMIAIQRENIHLIKSLLNLQCDIGIKDLNGKTALDYARETNNSEIIALLD